MRRPLLIGLPVVAALLLIATPFLHIRFATPDDRVLPTSLDSRQVGDDLRTNFQGNAAALLYAVVRGPATPDQVAQCKAPPARGDPAHPPRPRRIGSSAARFST